MKIISGIWVGVVCLCTCVIAQNKYDSHHISQEVQYDDDEPTYNQQPAKYGLVREPSSGGYERKYGEQNPPLHYRPVSSPYPQPPSYPSPAEGEPPYYHKTERQVVQPSHYQPKDPPYHQPKDIHYRKLDYHKSEEGYARPQSEDSKTRESQYDQPEELQYSHEPEQPSHYQPGSAPGRSYPSPAVSYKLEQQSYHQPSSAPETSYSPGQPSYRQPSSAPDTSYPPGQPSYHQPSSAPETAYPPTAKRDPKLPLYFTMYEKRIIQDPTDKYGKGPWRYLTYGHGITYGSKEPGKVFEKGYGYIRALGRDHCKLPENQCPPRDDKPFDYDGRKEPYFGYRPH